MPTPPAPHKRSHVKLLLIAIIVVLVVSAALLLLGASGSFSGHSVSLVRDYPSPTPSPKLLPTLTPEIFFSASGPTKVTTVPRNVNQFEKQVVTANQCENPIGLVSYHDKATDTWMKINNVYGTQTKESKVGLVGVDAFLHGKQMKPYEDLIPWEEAFHGYCGGASNMFVREIPGIGFGPGVLTRAFIAYTTQATEGTVSIVVYAQNGNDVIQLSKFVNDPTLYKPLIDACPAQPNTNDASASASTYQSIEDCYKDKLAKDPNLLNVATETANNLTTTFKLP